MSFHSIADRERTPSWRYAMFATSLKCSKNVARSSDPRFRKPNRRCGVRSQLELLEDRCVPSGFTHLNPGGPVDLKEQLPVNFVFVGYEPELVNEVAFRAALPSRSDPIIRSRASLGIREEIGVHYTYDYK